MRAKLREKEISYLALFVNVANPKINFHFIKSISLTYIYLVRF